jgi:outer membrane protein assembly factor BamE (lipoprotein component of BamABCDE complex)
MKRKHGAILVMCLLAAVAMMASLTACGMTNEERGIDVGLEESVTPIIAPVDASELPGDFASLTVGMTTDEVRDLLGYPATIQEIEGKQVHKYFINEGKNRLYLMFMDEKLSGMELSTP